MVQCQTKNFFTACVPHTRLVQDYCRLEVLIFSAIFSLVLLVDLGFLTSLGHLQLCKNIIHVSYFCQYVQ